MTVKASIFLFVTAVAYLVIYRTEDGVVWFVLSSVLLAMAVWHYQTWPRKIKR